MRKYPRKSAKESPPTRTSGSSSERRIPGRKMAIATAKPKFAQSKPKYIIASGSSSRSAVSTSSSLSATPAKAANSEFCYVTTIMGKKIKLEITEKMTVLDLKKLISAKLDSEVDVDSQLLVFIEKQLEDHMLLKDYGIQDQSTVKLVLKMSGGPGSQIRMKRLLSPLPEQIIFLLCKQVEELYILEIHLKEGSQPRTVTRHKLEPSSAMLDFLGSNDYFDISDLCEVQLNSESSDDLDIEEEIEDHLNHKSGFSEDDVMDNGYGTSEFSKSSIFSSIRTASGGSNDSSLSSALQSLLWENEKPDLFETGSIYSNSSSNSSKQSIRPATAMSLMRIKDSVRPMLVIPKSRPASAAVWIQGFKNQLSEFELSKSNDSISSLNFKLTLANSGGLSASSSISELLQFSSISIKPKIEKIDTNKATYSLLPIARLKTPGKSAVMIIKAIRSCCDVCSKKLGPAQRYKCKCELTFCGIHRYSDRHSCYFDGKTVGRNLLTQNNPLIQKEKLQRI